jgi:hypothetical protein
VGGDDNPPGFCQAIFYLGNDVTLHKSNFTLAFS